MSLSAFICSPLFPAPLQDANIRPLYGACVMKYLDPYSYSPEVKIAGLNHFYRPRTCICSSPGTRRVLDTPIVSRPSMKSVQQGFDRAAGADSDVDSVSILFFSPFIIHTYLHTCICMEYKARILFTSSSLLPGKTEQTKQWLHNRKIGRPFTTSPMAGRRSFSGDPARVLMAETT